MCKENKNGQLYIQHTLCIAFQNIQNTVECINQLFTDIILQTDERNRYAMTIENLFENLGKL